MVEESTMEANAVTTEEEHWHPPYWKIFVILLVLTVLEMGLAFFPVRWIALSLMTIIAVTKIAYIARYFMHLKFDQRLLGAVACMPIFFTSCMIFYLLLEFG